MVHKSPPPRRYALAGAVMALLAAHVSVAGTVDDNNLPGHVERLDSARLVEMVLARNPDLPAMQAAWEAARARIEQAEALDDPTLSYTVAPRTVSVAGLDFGQRLYFSQRLPWPGKRDLRGDAARTESDAAQEGIKQARLRLAEAAKAAYADWYFVHAAIRINRINKSLLQEFRNIAEIKYTAGRASKQDALRAEVEVALLEHRDIVLDRRRSEVLAVLNTLLQRLPDASLPPPADLPETIPLPPVAQLRAAALEVHPDLRALAARIRAGRSRVALAERDFYPDIQLSAGYNSLWNQQEKRLTVGVGINIPLQGKRRAARDQAKAGLLRLGLERKSKVSQVLGAVQRAYDRVRESAHVIALYRDRLLPLAEENLAAARADYQAGSGDFLDLITAEKNLMQTQLQLERARADYHRRLSALERAAGGPQVLGRIAAGGDAS